VQAARKLVEGFVRWGNDATKLNYVTFFMDRQFHVERAIINTAGKKSCVVVYDARNGSEGFHTVNTDVLDREARLLSAAIGSWHASVTYFRMDLLADGWAIPNQPKFNLGDVVIIGIEGISEGGRVYGVGGIIQIWRSEGSGNNLYRVSLDEYDSRLEIATNVGQGCSGRYVQARESEIIAKLDRST